MECSQIICHCHKLKKEDMANLFQTFEVEKKTENTEIRSAIKYFRTDRYINVTVVPSSHSAVLNQVT